MYCQMTLYCLRAELFLRLLGMLYNVVDFKSHYNKIKRSKMDISNIYLKTECFEIFAFKAELKLVDLEINKGINAGY